MILCVFLATGCVSASGRVSNGNPFASTASASVPKSESHSPLAHGQVIPASAEIPVQDGELAESTVESAVPPGAELIGNGALSPGFGPAPPWLPDGYLIQPGDLLAIKFRVTPDLNEEVIVRPDGMIALHLVGDVMAAYITPEQLAAALEAAFKDYLRDPQLTVIVRTFAGNQVYVGGEVQMPGSLALSGRITTLQAIIQAGGFRDTADRRHVIIRHAGGGCHVVDLQAELHGRKFNQDVPLQPYDVVYVQKSGIAKANLWVDQYINRIIPFQRSFGYFLSFSTFNTAAVASGP